MIKRLVSMILCIFALCQMVCVDSYAFDWPWSQIKSQQNSADPKNKCGNFEDVEYLKNKCLKKLKNGKGFCRQLNIGPQCQTDLWFWDYVQIKEALSNLRKCSLNMESTIVDEIVLNVADTIKSLFKTDFEIAKETAKYWLSESIIIKNFSKSKFQTEKNNLDGARAWLGAGVGGLVGAAGAGAFIPGVGQVLLVGQAIISAACLAKGIFNTYIVAQNNNGSTKLYSMAFDKILSGIIHGCWEQGDVVSLRISRNPGKDYGEHVDFIKRGVHYDENIKEGYEHMFGDLEEMLINIANRNIC